MKNTSHPWWYYSFYNSIFSYNRNYKEEIDILLKNITIQGLTVQEIGAGTGNHSKYILEKNPLRLQLIDSDIDSISSLKNQITNYSNISYLNVDGFSNLTEFNSKIDLVISTFSIIQQVSKIDEFRKRCFNVVKRLRNDCYFVFEFIDYDIAKFQFVEKQKNLLFSDENSNIYISSKNKKQHTIIEYSGILNNKEIFYKIELINLSCIQIENQLRKISCICEFTNISSEGRRKFCFVKRSFSLKKPILIIGSSGVGKSTIGEKIEETIPVNVIDVDKMFIVEYGEIEEYGNKYGWGNYFRKQSEIIQKYFIANINNNPTIFIMPASSLFHKKYKEISEYNKQLTLNASNIICILAHEQHELGAEISLSRQLNRSYIVNENLKIQQYIYQSEYYTKLSNLVIVNKDINKSVKSIINYLKNE